MDIRKSLACLLVTMRWKGASESENTLRAHSAVISKVATEQRKKVNEQAIWLVFLASWTLLSNASFSWTLLDELSLK